MTTEEYFKLENLKINYNYYDNYKKQIVKGSYEYYLYHSKKNIDYILWFLVLTPIFFLFSGGGMIKSIIYVVLLWITYFLLCINNNYLMNKDNKIIEKRNIAFKIYLEKNNLW